MRSLLTYFFLAILAFGGLLQAQNTVPEKMPEFSLKDIDGKEFSIAEHADKPVLINFWATWCPPCRKEIPDLIRIQKDHPELLVLGIALDQDMEKVGPFAAEQDINYPVLYGTGEVVEQFGGIRFIPQTFLYNKDGRLVQVFNGLVTEKDLKKALELL